MPVSRAISRNLLCDLWRVLNLELRASRHSSVFAYDRRSSRPRPDHNPFSRPLRPFPELSSPNITYEERVRSKTAQPKMMTQIYDYFLVLDFEATCDRTPIAGTPEIIEFPVVKVDARTMQPVATFHQYVRPRVNPNLTAFCTQLTGIIQDMIEGQPQFEEVLTIFDKWMHEEGLLEPDVKFAFVTCGDWDLGTMLPRQADYSKVPVPRYFDQWINIKHAFSEVIGHYPRGLMLMLEGLGIKHTGRHHSGIDDCRNIVEIMRGLAQRSYVFRAATQKFLPKAKGGRFDGR